MNRDIFTPWFNGRIHKPEGPGVYQLCSGSGNSLGYQYWDGAAWHTWCGTVDEAHLERFSPPVCNEAQQDDWRGLTYDSSRHYAHEPTAINELMMLADRYCASRDGASPMKEAKDRLRKAIERVVKERDSACAALGDVVEWMETALGNIAEWKESFATDAAPKGPP